MSFKIKFLSTIFFIFFTFLAKAQHFGLWSESDILDNESRVLKAFNKYLKKQSKDALRRDFLITFEERVKYHNAVIGTILQEEDNSKNWVDWINRLRSLALIYTRTAEMLAKNNVKQYRFEQRIDSVKNAAVARLYAKGTKALEDKASPFNYAIAFRSLSIVQLLHPGYENTERLLSSLKLLGSKGAILTPVQMGNMGNYTYFQFSGVSDLSNYITSKVMNSLSDAVGFAIQTQADGTTAYNINCTWSSISFNQGNKNKNKIARSATEKNAKILATVEYTTQNFYMNASFDVVILDKISGNIIGKKTINSNGFTEYVTASYTGDPKALTDDDRRVINRTDRSSINDFKNEYIKTSYDKSIHHQLCDFINKTLGW